jgi:hypothetical protein
VTMDATTFDDAGGPPVGNSGETAVSPTRARLDALWQSIERFLIYTGDWLNPILVNETRQALKSSQFAITFVLVLVAGWIATIAVVSFIGPRIFYSADGGTLLFWYFLILSLPLMVVVPLSAFRSLTAEREENTYELLSITTLKPRQIISGKLGSSIAQMAVYFSAVTPCLAFTYLLRGVDLPTIAMLLVFAFFWSLGLCMVGILLATLTEQRFAQVFILVAFVAALFLMFYLSAVLGYYASYLGRAATWGVGSEFWMVVALMATFYITFFALAFFASAGLITFTSENRSTPLRICMIVQQAAFVGWVSYGWFSEDYAQEILLVTGCFAGIYWYARGTMLTAEKPGMSQRIRRRLPQSYFGRMFFSWFNPGPASGYLFVIANITALAIIWLMGTTISSIFSTRTRGGWPSADVMWYLTVISWGYIVAYLGVGLLLVTALRKFATVTMLACVLIHLLLLLAGFGVPYAIKSMSLKMREADYSFIQITDPFYSLAHVGDGGLITDAAVIGLIVPAVAICVLLLNMPSIIRELRVIREAAPARVIQDEVELHPLPEEQPQNPWDEPA